MGLAVPALACRVAPRHAAARDILFRSLSFVPEFFFEAPSRSWEDRRHWGSYGRAVNPLVFEEGFACGQRDRESWRPTMSSGTPTRPHLNEPPEPELAPWVAGQSGLVSVTYHQKNLEGRGADGC